MDRIELNNLTRTYYDAQGETFCALDHAALIWEQGHSIAIMGESGSGKSTLARLLIGIEKPTSGIITWNGEDISRWKASAWREKRKHIQAVFQDASGTLNPARSVYSNVEEALRNLTKLDKQQRRGRIGELMELTHMDSHLLRVPIKAIKSLTSFLAANSADYLCSEHFPFIRNFWCWMKLPAAWTFFPQMRCCKFWSDTTRNLAVPIC